LEKIEFKKKGVNTTDVAKKFGIFGQNLETTKLREKKYACVGKHTLLLVLILATKIMFYLTSLWFKSLIVHMITP
jgi:hypothetical protein